MRAMPFTRDFGEEGEYIVIGTNDNSDIKWDEDKVMDCNCKPIQMSLTRCVANRFGDDDLKAFIGLADSDMFMGGYYERKNYADFRKNYAEILRGNRPDWYISAFRLFVGGIQLYLINPQTHDNGFLWVVGARRLDITFQAPRTRLGFAPTYHIKIKHEGGRHLHTEVKEDLGYVRYEGELKLKDPRRKDDDLFHSGNQYFEGMEYAGL